MTVYEPRLAASPIRPLFDNSPTPSIPSVNSRIPYFGIELTRAMALDIVERTIIAILFCTFGYRLLVASAMVLSIATILLVESEVLPAFFIIIRRHSASHSDKLIDWCLGFIGTNVALLTVPTMPGTFITQEWCSIILLLGFSIQVAAKITLGRSFGIVAANRGVKVEGPYRIVRHPIYAGYTIAHIGFLLGFPSLPNLLIYSASFGIQVFRMLREERLLNQDPNYRAYAARVRYRIVPLVF